MSQRDGRDLARILLRRAHDDATLVRRVADDADIADAIVGSPWAVEFRYETDDEPPLDRRATLSFIEGIRRWAGETIER